MKKNEHDGGEQRKKPTTTPGKGKRHPGEDTSEGRRRSGEKPSFRFRVERKPFSFLPMRAPRNGARWISTARSEQGEQRKGNQGARDQDFSGQKLTSAAIEPRLGKKTSEKQAPIRDPQK